MNRIFKRKLVFVEVCSPFSFIRFTNREKNLKKKRRPQEPILSPSFTSPRFTSPCFTSPRFTSPRFTSLRFTSPVQSSPRNTVCLIWPSIRFVISLQIFKKPLDISLTANRKKTFQRIFSYNSGCKRKLWAIFLPQVRLWKKQTPGSRRKPA